MAKAPRFRRMTDIDRLAQQYSRSINELTGQYETSFSDYQKQVAQQMAPFEEASTRYKTEILPAYEQQAQNYRKRLEDYQKALQEYIKSPIQELSFGVGTTASPDAGKNVKIQPNKQYDWRSQTMYRIKDLGNEYYTPYALEQLGWEVSANAAGTLDSAIKRNPKPTFAEKAPVAPTAPTAPKVAAFDASQFEQRRGQLQEEYSREVGERRAGKLAAVSRRSRRPMLQGA